MMPNSGYNSFYSIMHSFMLQHRKKQTRARKK